MSFWGCEGCGASFSDSDADMIVDHVMECWLVDGASNALETVLVCDPCQDVALGESTPEEAEMFNHGECEDYCNLPLDHDGVCSDVPTSGQTRCDHCGNVARLHELDTANIAVHNFATPWAS